VRAKPKDVQGIAALSPLKIWEQKRANASTGNCSEERAGTREETGDLVSSMSGNLGHLDGRLRALERKKGGRVES